MTTNADPATIEHHQPQTTTIDHDLIKRIADRWYRPDGSPRYRIMIQNAIRETAKEFSLTISEAATAYEHAMLHYKAKFNGDHKSYWALVNKMTTNECVSCGLAECKENCPMRQPYEHVLRSINESDVSAEDFNGLLNAMAEAVDKSARERVARHLRIAKLEPNDVSMADRTTARRNGRNDPPRQGRGRRYASGKPAKERQNEQQRMAWSHRDNWDGIDESAQEFLTNRTSKPSASAIVAVAKIFRDGDYRAMVEECTTKIDDTWLNDVMATANFIMESTDKIDEDQLREVAKALNLCPDYGRIFVHQNDGMVYLMSSDSDDSDVIKAAIEKLRAVSGVNDVECESEVGPPKKSGWRQIHPTVRAESLSVEAAESPTELAAKAKAMAVQQLTEDAGPHKFASTQFNFPTDIADQIRAYAATIPDEEIDKDGREDEIHCTIKYGLHKADPKKIREIIKGFGPVTVTLDETSLFTSSMPGGKPSSSDVLKIGVKGDKLHKLHALLADNIENTETYKNYAPHATIAYLKPGAGEKYGGSKRWDGTQMTFNSFILSDQDGTKHVIELGDEAVTEDAKPVVAQDTRSGTTICPHCLHEITERE